jgi:Nucleoside 2-deoxyribosyltransferase
MAKGIYLAGKISRYDWRHDIVKGLRNVYSGDCEGDFTGIGTPDTWTALPKAVFGLDYMGPYFISDDHGCCHGADSHGAAAIPGHNGNSRQSEVTRWCTNAIERSDIIFAWLEDTTCYGTLVELGYAKALGKTIWIAGIDARWIDSDLWFACNLADEVYFEEWLNPSIAIQILLAKAAKKDAI